MARNVLLYGTVVPVFQVSKSQFTNNDRWRSVW